MKDINHEFITDIFSVAFLILLLQYEGRISVKTGTVYSFTYFFSY